MKTHSYPFLIGSALFALGAVTEAVPLVTNGGFESQVLADPEIVATVDGWAETAAPEEIGVFRNDAGFLAPLGNTNLVYMGAGSQILQTFGVTLQPNTKYTVSFQCYMSLGAPAGASLTGALCYGSGSGSSSAFAGFIDAADIQLGASGFSTPLANTPTSLTATFTTGASIVGSASNLAIYINPGVQPGAQIFLDNVQVTAESAVPTTQAELVTNADFSAGAAIFGGSPTNWNATVAPETVGQFSPGGVPAPLSGQVAYLGTSSQIVQTLGQTLLPDTTYYISFDFVGSVGDFTGTNTLDGFIGYGTGSGGTSGFAGFIAGGDLLSGSNAWAPRITTSAQRFNVSFTTPSVIIGSPDNLAIILNPVFDATGNQVYLDNVSVIAASQSSGTPVLSYSQSGNFFTLSWPADVTGWTLESSTDLGIGDLWDPVPGVVNNSVTLDMTGLPKNFFRLKSTP